MLCHGQVGERWQVCAQREAQHRQRVARPGVEVEGIGAVEHQRAHAAGMAESQRLRREGAVGVAVDVDPPQPQRVQHVDHVVDRRARAVGVAAAPEAGAAAADREPVGPERDGRERGVREVLERRAVDQLRLAGAPLVDEQERGRAARGPEHREVVAGRADRRVARPALDGEQRVPGRAAGRRVAAERDAHRARGRIAANGRARRSSRSAPSANPGRARAARRACAGAAAAGASTAASRSRRLTGGCCRAAAWGARRAW